MIDMKVHAALPDEERERLLGMARSMQRAAERNHAELLLAEAAVIAMRHFGDEVGAIRVHVGPTRFGDQALISEIVAADGSVIWADLRRGQPMGAPWEGEGKAQEHITRAWLLSPGAFRPVDERMGLYEVRLHRAREAATR